MSTTSYNVEYNNTTTNNNNAKFKAAINNTQQTVRQTSSIEDLKKRAHVNKADTELYDVKSWVNTVTQLYEEGAYAIVNNDLENAYISYMRGCSIMVEVIRVHSHFKDIYKDPIFISLDKKTNSEILPLLNELALRIDSWYKMAKQLTQSNSTPTTHNPYNMYFNSSPINPISASSAVYAFRPNHDPRNFPHYTMNDIPSQTVSPALLYPPSSNSPNLFNPQPSPNSMSPSMSNQLTIEPSTLGSWLTTKTNPPSILLIDARPREVFKNLCIKHKWIIQIEPSILTQSDSTLAIQDYLSNYPNPEQILFLQRSKVDLIVYYDQNSRTLDTKNKPLCNLKKVLDNSQLRRPAMMLTGGFDAWVAAIGERGVYKFSTTKEKKHWFKSSSSSSSSSSLQDHNSLYDYFTGKGQSPHQFNQISKPQPLPTATRKESLTTRYQETLSPTSEIMQKQQDIQPIPPSYPKLHRRRTFIDNPFNGFTTTTSNLYDVPPMVYQNEKGSSNSSTPTLHIQQRPSSAEPTVSISRPSALAEFHHSSTSNLHASPNGFGTTFSELRSVVSIGTTGLKNLGNTCYMNSIIQCLSGTVPLARYFTSGMYKQYINRGNKQGTGGILAESFAELIREMWSESYNFIAPMTFREALIRYAPQFSGNDQQDSQEFLLFLLDGLHEDMNQINLKKPQAAIEDESQFEKLPDWQASMLCWERYMEKNKSIIVSLFQGQYRSRLTCLTCKHTSTTYNVFMSLSLPIPAKKLRISSVTLYQCLDYFVKEETLDKEDAWKCPKCQKKRKALKQLTLAKLPDILLIHLKRFSADGLFRNKLDATVKCPTRSLDLSNYVPMSMTPNQDRPSFVYDLYAVSNHYGSLSGGHYTACVRDRFKDKWHYFDDSKFSLCDEHKVVTKAAYNLFYVRSKVK